MIDVYITETGNGGDLQLTGSDMVTVSGFENMIYLALFGGNTEGSYLRTRSAAQQDLSWWGNSLMPDTPSQQFNSDTERTLRSTPLTSSGRVLIEAAVYRDLDFMRAFAEINVKVLIIDSNKLKIIVLATEPANLQTKEYVYIWDGMRLDYAGSSYTAPGPFGGTTILLTDSFVTIGGILVAI